MRLHAPQAIAAATVVRIASHPSAANVFRRASRVNNTTAGGAAGARSLSRQQSQSVIAALTASSRNLEAAAGAASKEEAKADRKQLRRMSSRSAVHAEASALLEERGAEDLNFLLDPYLLRCARPRLHHALLAACAAPLD